MENEIPFSQRFGLKTGPPISNDFPNSARIALSFLIEDLVENAYVIRGDEDGSWIGKWIPIVNELQRVARKPSIDFQPFDSHREMILQLINEMKWDQVYIFCERIYSKFLTAGGYLSDNTTFEGEIISIPDEWVETKSINEVREYYSKELNNILVEENIVYQFVNGQFQRRGRAQTQKIIQRIGTVLNSPELTVVRNHYNKARKFFDERPNPDVENCVKEALCSLEACVELLAMKSSSKDFLHLLRQFQGNEPDKIPTPIIEGIIKIHAYRGSGQGVAHAAMNGYRVTEIEAELILNLVASYITYLVDFFASQQEDEIPF